MAQSLQFFRRIMLLLNITVCVFLAWVFGMTPVLAARQSDGVAFTQNLSALPAKPWTLTAAILSMAALIVVGVLRRRSYHFVGWTEPLFALCVIFALHLDYNGLLLYVVVDLIDGLHGRTRCRFLGVMTALFLLTGLGALAGSAAHGSVFGISAVFLTCTRGSFCRARWICWVHCTLSCSWCTWWCSSGRGPRKISAIRRLNGELEQANDRLSVMNEQLKDLRRRE